MHEQNGAAVSRTKTQSSPINGLFKARTAINYEQWGHETTPQGTQHRCLQATKKKSKLGKETKQRKKESSTIA